MSLPTITLCTLPIVEPGEKRQFMDKQKAFRAPRLGVQVIRDYLIQEGYSKDEVKFLDIEMLAPSDNDLKLYFRSNQPDVVGLSAVLSHSYQQVKRIARIIRSELPNAWIVVGGNLSASANVVLRKTEVDCCVVGDGEEIFLNLVNHIKCGNRSKNFELLKEIRGLSFLDKNGELHFNGYPKKPKNETIPFPDYEFFESGLLDKDELLDRYFLPVEQLGMWFCLDPRSKQSHRRPYVAQFYTSKGCTARCTFCQRNTRGYRLADLDEMEAHLKIVIEKYNVGFIACMDENFGGRSDYARAFADLMEKYDLLWTAGGVRCTNVTREDVEYFKAKGCCSLKFGVESGSQDILDSMEKNFTIEDVEKALTACWDNGLFSPLALMVGMPGEDDQTIRNTGEFIGKMAYELGIDPQNFDKALFYALPFPGTPLYDHCLQVGLIENSVDTEEQYLVSIANGLTNKWHYLNVNGAPVSHVLSWDYLVEWQAAKTYRQLSRKKPKEKSDLARKWETYTLQTRDTHIKKKLSRNRRISIYLMLVTVDRVYRSVFVRMLPTWLAYLFIRTSFYLATLCYHWIGRLIGRPTFAMYKDRPKPKRYRRPSSHAKRLARSLRAVVNSNRLAIENPTELAREKLLKGAAN